MTTKLCLMTKKKNRLKLNQKKRTNQRHPRADMEKKVFAKKTKKINMQSLGWEWGNNSFHFFCIISGQSTHFTDDLLKTILKKAKEGDDDYSFLNALTDEAAENEMDKRDYLQSLVYQMAISWSKERERADQSVELGSSFMEDATYLTDKDPNYSKFNKTSPSNLASKKKRKKPCVPIFFHFRGTAETDHRQSGSPEIKRGSTKLARYYNSCEKR